ncbi:MAG: hypothetical protein II008_19600 [Oscillospiraceae bacterium]|nr:hypothetical protein [Oscillospiraceae bacterium]
MADLIDRQAAIDALESKAYRHTYLDQIVGIIEDLPSAQPKGYTDQLRWERDTAIQQLKELGYGLGEKPRTDGDTISRQALKEKLSTLWDRHDDQEFADKDIWRELENAPTIEERKTGEWIREEKHYKDSEQEYYYYEEHCSVCGAMRKIGWAEANYCPNCGARMEGEEDDRS